MRSLRIRVGVSVSSAAGAAFAALGIVAAQLHDGGTIQRGIVAGLGLFAFAAVIIAGLQMAPVLRELSRSSQWLRRVVLSLHEDATSSGPISATTGLIELVGALESGVEGMRAELVARHDERARLDALLAASADGMLALDGDDVVRYANRAAESLFGPAVGRTYVEVVRQHELAEVATAGRNGEPNESPTVQLPAWGMWVQATAGAIPFGGDWASLVILRDVTAVRRAEITRRDFIANVSHELRTPLAGLKAVVETLQNGALDDRHVAEDFLNRADAEVDRLVHLVDELLQLARLEAGTPIQTAEVDLRWLLADVVDRFQPQADRAGVELRLRDSDPAWPIEADAARLGQAVGNLIHNAIKFTAAGGWVEVEFQDRGEQVEIAVSDSGCGIDPVDLARVFERFYVADRARSGGGTGLGLAIVKHVVLAHGGSVDAESTPGRGSTFRLTVPRSAAPRSATITQLGIT